MIAFKHIFILHTFDYIFRLYIFSYILLPTNRRCSLRCGLFYVNSGRVHVNLRIRSEPFVNVTGNEFLLELVHVGQVYKISVQNNGPVMHLDKVSTSFIYIYIYNIYLLNRTYNNIGYKWTPQEVIDLYML